MKELFFWKHWTLPERATVWGITGFLTLALVCLVVISHIFGGSDPVNWDVLSRLTDTLIPANQLDFGTFNFTIQTPSVAVTEEYIAPLMLPDTTVAIFFLVIALVGLAVVFAALTTLSRFWFFGGLAVFILLLVFSRTEILELRGLPERSMLFLILALYGGAGYYFHAFKPHVTVVIRILAFVVISIVLGVVVGLLSTAPNPAYAFLVYSLPLWLVMAVIFLIISATEIWYGLIWLTTSKVTGMGQRALPNFLIIALVYLLILVFAYVGNTKMANWGIVIMPAYLLGAVAAIIGLWGFRPRCDSTEGHLPFRESGFWLYSGLFLITIAMTGMAVAANNDPLLEVLEDTVVNGQLGMGAAFFFYIVINFLPLLRQGLSVHKVLYKPLKFSLTRARIIGVGIVVVLFSMQNLFPVKQGIAAYFNGLGDWHTLAQEYTLAEQYYQLSLQQEFQNHKANYSLASLARIQGDNNAAVFFFRQATLKKPSPQAYIGLSNLLMDDNLYFESVFNLKEGIRKFPDSGPLLNNLGLLYAKTNLSDSSYYFLKAAEKVLADGIPATNIIGILAGTLDASALDSIAVAGREYNSLSWHANRLLVQNLASKFRDEKEKRDAIRSDSLLNAASYAYWLNYIYNQGRNDSLVAVKARHIIRKNEMLADELLLAAAHADFYGGNKTAALETILVLLSSDSQKSDLYHKVLGLWFLQLKLYNKAIENFSLVNDAESIAGHAIAQVLSGNPVSGAVVLEKLRDSDTDSLQLNTILHSVVSLRPLVTRADSLLIEAKRVRTESAYRNALRSNPFDPEIVSAAVEFFQETKPDSPEAYQIVVNALRFNETSPRLWADYALLNLDLGLSELAEEAREKVKELSGDTDYHDFHTRYQAKWSLKQKLRDEFR